MLSTMSCKIGLLRQRFTVKQIYVSKGMRQVVIRQCRTAKDIQNILKVLLEVIHLDTANSSVIMKS